MSYTDLREVRHCYASLRELVVQKNGGRADAESLAGAVGLCVAGIAALDDAECRDRLRAVQAQLGELFSSSRHLKWARKQMSGADYLRLQILIHLEAVNTRLFMLEAQRDRRAA
jgi:hypothetical protein